MDACDGRALPSRAPRLEGLNAAARTVGRMRSGLCCEVHMALPHTACATQQLDADGLLASETPRIACACFAVHAFIEFTLHVIREF